jgi:hypothetical protein
MKLKEIADSRAIVNSGIDKMMDKMKNYRQHTFDQFNRSKALKSSPDKTADADNSKK